jgi:hypothetical protein
MFQTHWFFPKASVSAASICAAIAFSGCSSGAATNTSGLSEPAIAPVAANLHTTRGAVPALKYSCNGTAGVHIGPCPAMLEPRRPHRNLYVYGSTVITAQIKESAESVCKHDTICAIRSTRATPPEFRISAGPKCGKAEVVLEAFNAQGDYVGDADLEVVNQDSKVCI